MQVFHLLLLKLDDLFVVANPPIGVDRGVYVFFRQERIAQAYGHGVELGDILYMGDVLIHLPKQRDCLLLLTSSNVQREELHVHFFQEIWIQIRRGFLFLQERNRIRRLTCGLGCVNQQQKRLGVVIGKGKQRREKRYGILGMPA